MVSRDKGSDQGIDKGWASRFMATDVGPLAKAVFRAPDFGAWAFPSAARLGDQLVRRTSQLSARTADEAVRAPFRVMANPRAQPVDLRQGACAARPV